MASVHETIVTIIRETAATVNPSGSFLYGSELDASFLYPQNSTPNSEEPKTQISLLPFTITKNTNSNLSYDSSNLSMVFSRSADVADTPQRKEIIMNEMASIAETFISILDEASAPISYSIGNVQMEANYHFWMGTNSGYIVTFQINVIKSC
jgi:hypothetical protein